MGTIADKHLIGIDVGHGGSDTGAHSNELIEKDMNLVTALATEEKLLATYAGHFDVFMTRRTDVTLSLTERCTMLNNKGVEIGHSQHYNASGTGADGSEAFHSVSYNEGRELALIMSKHIAKLGQNLRGDMGTKTRLATSGQGDYYTMIAGTHMPFVIIEPAFIDSAADRQICDTSEEQKAIGYAIADAYAEYFGIPVVEGVPKSTGNTKTTILGTETVTVEQCEQFVAKVNPNAPKIASIYKKYGEKLGIRWGRAFAQMVKETDYLRFTGTVVPEQHNPAGIGTTGATVKGAYFRDFDEGVLAQMEHLFAYSSKQPLPADLPKVDPRFSMVARGSAICWEDLNGRWAVPGNGYGQDICDIYAKVASEVVVAPKPAEPKTWEQFITGARVQDLQVSLNSAGYRDNAGGTLNNDGYLGDKTLEALANVIVHRGDSNTIVLAIQNRLFDLGYKLPKYDGKFDTATEELVKKFQADKGLVAHGIVELNTLKALFKK